MGDSDEIDIDVSSAAAVTVSDTTFGVNNISIDKILTPGEYDVTFAVPATVDLILTDQSTIPMTPTKLIINTDGTFLAFTHAAVSDQDIPATINNLQTIGTIGVLIA